MKMTTYLLLLVSNISTAKPPLTAAEICLTISSNKHEAQCKTVIRGKSFEQKALFICLKHKNDDYKKTRCMEAISDKKYKHTELDYCTTESKVPLDKCLSVSGSTTNQNQDSSSQISEEPIKNSL